MALELTDFDNVVACATEVQRLGVPLDMLICNAGVIELPTLEQVRGIEMHFVTNNDRPTDVIVPLVVPFGRCNEPLR